MRHRIVLCGFSEFEHRAMHFSFLHPAQSGNPGYDVVTSLDDADFAVVDADSPAAIEGVVQSGRVADAVFVGAVAPAGAISHLQRPIDPTRILRAVAELRAAHAMSEHSGGTVPGSLHASLPTLDDLVLAPLVAPRGRAAGTGTPAPVRAHTRAWDRADDEFPADPASASALATPVLPRSGAEPVELDEAADTQHDTEAVTLTGPFDDAAASAQAPALRLIDPVLADDPIDAPLTNPASDWVVSDPPSPVPAEPPADAPADAASNPIASPAHAAKAAARAAARRARLAADAALHATQPTSRDVLVLDADPDASVVLCELLQLFGFDVHAVRSLEAAQAALGDRSYAAVFLDTPLEGPGLEMVRQVRAAPTPAGQATAAVVLLRAQLHPADRVRAVLAGVGEPLLKPVSRGAVARALEGLGVALPVDARRI